jgi:hypothetical protein
MRAYRNPWENMRVSLVAVTEDAAAQPLLMVQQPRATQVQPFITISDEEAQAFMDSLWEVGIRPAGAQGSAEEKAALVRHLDDMRRIAFLHIDGGKP